MGRTEDMLVALLGMDSSVHGVVHHRFAKEPDGRFLLSEVNVLALAGAPAVVQGSQNGSQAAQASNGVGVGADVLGAPVLVP